MWDGWTRIHHCGVKQVILNIEFSDKCHHTYLPSITSANQFCGRDMDEIEENAVNLCRCFFDYVEAADIQNCEINVEKQKKTD